MQNPLTLTLLRSPFDQFFLCKIIFLEMKGGTFREKFRQSSVLNMSYDKIKDRTITKPLLQTKRTETEN